MYNIKIAREGSKSRLYASPTPVRGNLCGDSFIPHGKLHLSSYPNPSRRLPSPSLSPLHNSSLAIHVRPYLMQSISSLSRRTRSQLMSSSIRPATSVASSRLALHSSHLWSSNNRNYTQSSAMAAEMTPVFAKDAAPRMFIQLFV